jgi:aminoglycoside phosphotransferase (APT) family kinase protein
VTEANVNARPALDLAALQRYLDGRLDLAGPLTAQLLAGGKSNLSFTVGDGSQQWVLRRPPLGHTLATAHDMVREHRVQAALADSVVPVPRMVLLCTDTEVLGAPFYLMERMAGRAIRDLSEFGSQPGQVADLADRMVNILADLHGIDPDAVGLGDFGRPENYNARQLDRWSRQLAASLTGDIPLLADLLDRLGRSIPGSPRPTIVHGDYRLDNLLIDRGSEEDGHRVTAVLDWEMSTLGDPLGDLALTLLYTTHVVPGETVDPDARSAVEVPGHPSVQQMIAHYAERSGNTVHDLRWYRAFAAFKLAAISQGVHHRYVHGGYGEHPNFADIGHLVAPLVAESLAVLNDETEGT